MANSFSGSKLDEACTRELESIVQCFEDAWRLGKRPPIADSLPSHEPLRTALLIELVHAELECRLRLGEAARVEEYVKQFPDLCRDEAVLQGLLDAEKSWRSKREPNLVADEFGDRLQRLLRGTSEQAADASDAKAVQPTYPIHAAPQATQGPDISSELPASPPGYDLVRELGRGGMAVVYEAHQRQPSRVVALKLLLSGLYATGQQLARFQAEVDALAKLQHANIVRVYEFGAHLGTFFFSMEFVSGGTLAAQLRRQLPTPRAAAEMIALLARAIHFAHQQGIVHRDLKPSNVLVDDEGKPKIGDFGLAKHMEDQDSQTQTGDVLGTPNYMAPEQVYGRTQDIGPATDVYALGAMLYEMLVGRPPFSSGTIPETFDLIKHQDPLPPRRLLTTIPRDLETICLTCLQKDPAKRYTSALALAEDIERFLTNHPILARPTGRLARAMKWVRRNPARASLLGSVMVLFATAAAALIGFTDYLSTKLDERTKQLKAEELKRKEAIRESLYHSDMRRGFQEYEGGEWAAIRTLLSRHTPQEPEERDLRGFEWSLMERVAQVRPRITSIPKAGRTVAFSPDSTLLACAGDFDHVRLINLATGKNESWPTSHKLGNRSAFSPDGDELACVDDEGRLTVWNVHAGPKSAWYWMIGSPPLRQLAFSRKGLLVTGTETFRILEWKKKKERGALPPDLRGVAIAVNPEGTALAVATVDGSWQVWGLEEAPLRPRFTVDHTVPLASIAWSADGQRVFTGDQTGRIIAWEARLGGRQFALVGHQGEIASLAVSPDGNHLASGGKDGTVRLWDLNTLRVRAILREHTDAVHAVAFSPDGLHLASTGADAKVCLWELTRLNAFASLRAPVPGVLKIAFDSGGKSLAVACLDNSVQVFEPGTLQEQQRHSGNRLAIQDLLMSPAGRTLAVVRQDGLVRLLDPANGNPLSLLPANTTLAVRNGQYVACATRDGAAHVLQWHDENLVERYRRKWANAEEIAGVAVTADGKRLAASSGTTLVCWDADSDQEIRLPQTHPVKALAWCPDGQRLLVSTRANVGLWHVAQAKRLDFLQSLDARGQHMPVSVDTLQVSSDSRIVMGLEKPGKLYVWDFANKRLLKQVEGVRDVALDHTGKRMTLIRQDGRALLFDLATWRARPIGAQQPGPVHSLAFSKDGKRLYSGSRQDRMIMRTFVNTPFVPANIIRQFGLGGANYDFVVPGSAADAVQQWDCTSGRLAKVLSTPDWVQVTSLATTPDAGRMIAGGEGGWLRTWKEPDLTGSALTFVSDAARKEWDKAELVRGIEVVTPVYVEKVRSIAVSPAGDFHAIISDDKQVWVNGGVDTHQRIQVRDAEGKVILSFLRVMRTPTFRLGSAPMAFCGPGLLAYGNKERVEIIDVASHGSRKGLTMPDVVSSLACSRDHKLLATGTQNRSIGLFDLTTSLPIRSWQAHGDTVTAVCFAPNNKTLASCSLDGTVKLWSVPSGEFLGGLPGPSGKVHTVAFSPGGDLLVCGGETPQGVGEIIIWRAAPDPDRTAR